MLLVVTVVVFLQVVFRYFLLQPLAWTEESARFLFIWVSLLGAVLGVKDRAHFAITMLARHFPSPVRTVLPVLTALGATFFFLVMITEGWRLVLLNRNQESPAIGVAMSIPYLAIPVSGLLMLYFVWAGLIEGWIAGRAAPGVSAKPDLGGGEAA